MFGSSPLPVVRETPAPYFKIENRKVEKQQQNDLPLQVPQKQEPDVYFNFSQHAQGTTTAIQQLQKNL